MIHTIAGRIGFGDGGPEATLPTVDAVGVDAQGRALIATEYDHRVQRVEVDSTITVIAGAGSGSADLVLGGSAPQTTFPQIRALGGMADGIILNAILRAITRLATDGSLSDLANTVLTSTSPCRGALTQGVLRISSSIR